MPDFPEQFISRYDFTGSGGEADEHIHDFGFDVMGLVGGDDFLFTRQHLVLSQMKPIQELGTLHLPQSLPGFALCAGRVVLQG